MARVRIQYGKVRQADGTLRGAADAVRESAEGLARVRRELPAEVGARRSIAQSLAGAQRELEEIAARLQRLRCAVSEGCSRYEQTEAQLSSEASAGRRDR